MSGFVYLIGTVDGCYKIGKSVDAVQRTRGIGLLLPYPPSIKHQISSANPIWLEGTLHKAFSHRRVNGEWFALSSEDVASIKTMVAANSSDDLPEPIAILAKKHASAFQPAVVAQKAACKSTEFRANQIKTQEHAVADPVPVFAWPGELEVGDFGKIQDDSPFRSEFPDPDCFFAVADSTPRMSGIERRSVVAVDTRFSAIRCFGVGDIVGVLAPCIAWDYQPALFLFIVFNDKGVLHVYHQCVRTPLCDVLQKYDGMPIGLVLGEFRRTSDSF